MRTPSLTFKAGGTLKEANFYIERSADDELPAALLRGEFCYVLTPRQMGKSSLRYRVSRRLSEQHGVLSATVDLTGLGTGTTQAEDWYFGIVDDIARQIGDESLRAATEDFWIAHAKLPIVQRFTRFLRELLLAQTDGRLVVFVDEIDAVRALPFGSDDFFAAIRAVYNARPDDPEYERLSICLLGVAQPGDLIHNEQITPFNIGTRIDLTDFERPQLASLESGLAATGASPTQLLDAVFDWTCGHPYMVQSLCAALVPSHDRSLPIAQGTEATHVEKLVERLFLQRSSGRNPNLDYAEKCFQRSDADPRVAKMLTLYGRIIRGEPIASDGRDVIQGALQLTGMVAPRSAGPKLTLQVRNRIFATVFDTPWVKFKQTERLLSEPIHRWLESGRNDDFVLRGEALREAEQWTDQRADITSDEQDFLRACWRVQSTEEKAKADAALGDARLAEAEKMRSQATAQAQMRKRTNRLLGLMVVTLTIALIAVYSQYRRATHEEQAKSAALQRETVERERAEQLAKYQQELRASTEQLTDLEKSQRTRADRAMGRAERERRNAEAKRKEAEVERARVSVLTQIERGARARLLTQIPGDIEALRIALLAVGPAVVAGTEPPAEAVDGLTTAAQARGYPLLSPWRSDASVAMGSFAPDGSRVLTISDGTACIWDARTGSKLLTINGHPNRVWAASLSPDGSHILTTGFDHTARIWDAKTGSEKIALKGHLDRVRAASFSSDGSRVVTASDDRTARIWDAKTGSEVFTLKGHSDWVRAASFSPEGSRVVTASDDGTARIWDAKTGESLFSIKGNPKRVPITCFSPDGNRVLSADDDGTARIRDTKTGAELFTLKGDSKRVIAASFSPDGNRVVTASGDGTARIWDAKTGSERLALNGHLDSVQAASFSSDGSRVLTASADHTARVWSARTGSELFTLKGHSDKVHSASFSPDGGRILTASSDGTARLWSAKIGSALLSIKSRSYLLQAATFSSDGRYVLTAGADKIARILDAKTGSEQLALKGHLDWVRAASFSSDGSRVVTASDDGTARIWDAKTGSEVFTLKGHSYWVRAASFSPEGSRVVTASDDGTARIWDAKTGSEVFTLKRHSDSVRAASFSPDGSRVATARSPLL